MSLLVVIEPESTCSATLSFDVTTATSFVTSLPYIIGEGAKQFTFNTNDVDVSDTCATGSIDLSFAAHYF